MSVEQSNYKIIIRSTLEQLEDAVNLHLAQGYVLAGGICKDDDRNYLQAIYIDPNKR